MICIPLHTRIILNLRCDFHNYAHRISSDCTFAVHQGVVFETFTGSCVIGGLPSVLTKKVFTTVVAKSTCFVVPWPELENCENCESYPPKRLDH